MALADACGVHDAPRETACAQLMQRLAAAQVDQVRVGWCDLHGTLRGKTLMPAAVPGALRDGVGMVSTLLLKDTSDRTAFKVFEAATQAELPGYGFAANLLLLPDPDSLVLLPWAPGTAWLRAQPWHADGTPVAADPRRALQQALQQLAAAGYALHCGLEVEFHIYRIVDERLDPEAAAWPGEPPRVQLLHPGYNLLSEAWADRAHDALAIVRRTAQGLGLPLRSLEIELGPSQFEAVFDPCDALTAADRMVLFRNGVKQALRRAGYHATFMCRPPFEQIMSSGWHLHQSLLRLADGGNAFMRDEGQGGAGDARQVLSDVGAQWLAGLLAHAGAAAVFGCSTVNAFGRFRPNALAPMAALWGRDNRGALLRVLGAPGDGATRIENRIGEPMANPYLYLASQVHAGLDGLRRGLQPPPSTESPYADSGAPALPASLDAALDALEGSPVLMQAFGPELLRVLLRIKRSEALRHAQAEDSREWQRREYFDRY